MTRASKLLSRLKEDVVPFRRAQPKTSHSEHEFRLSPAFLAQKTAISLGDWEKVDAELKRIDDLQNSLPDADSDVMDSIEAYLAAIEKRLEASRAAKKRSHLSVVKEESLLVRFK